MLEENNLPGYVAPHDIHPRIEDMINLCVLDVAETFVEAIPIEKLNIAWKLPNNPNLIIRLIGSASEDNDINQEFSFLPSLASFSKNKGSLLFLQGRNQLFFQKLGEVLNIQRRDKWTPIGIIHDQNVRDLISVNQLKQQFIKFKHNDDNAQLIPVHQNIKHYVVSSLFPRIQTHHFECIMLYNGTLTELLAISDYISAEKPLIILKGSGGIADALAECLDVKNAKSYWEIMTEYMASYETENISIDARSLVSRVISFLNKIDKCFQVISISDVSNKVKLAKAILRAFTGNRDIGNSRSETNLKFLKLCVHFNELPVAVAYANLHRYIRVGSLDLRCKELAKLAVKLQSYSFLQYLVNQKPNTRTVLSMDVWSEVLTEGEKEKDLQAQVDTILRVKKDCETNIEQEKTIEYYFKLAIWSNLHELSKIMWQNVQSPTGAALYAYGCLKIMRSQATSEDEKLKLSERMKDFENYACETISRTYSSESESALKILGVKMAQWGNLTCFVLALKFEARKFLSQSASLHFVNTTWKKGLPLERTTPSPHEEICSYCKNKLRTTKKGLKCWHCDVREVFSPFLLLIFRGIGLTVFLMMFSALLISYLEQKSFHWLEWILWIWIATFAMEIVNQTVQNRVIGRHDIYKWLELSSVVLFLFAWIVRLIGYMYPDDQAWIFCARILFSIDFIGFCTCLLELCFMVKLLGPLLLMIMKMMKILLQFLFILLIACFAYAIASESVMFPEAEMNSKLYFWVLRKAFWAIFGDFSMDDLDPADGTCTNNPDVYNNFYEKRCPEGGGKYFVFPLLGVYYIFSNVLLINLLIATFNSRIVSIQEIATQVWNEQFSQITWKYYKVMFPPGPLVLLAPLLWMCRTEDLQKPFAQDFPPEILNKLHAVESNIRYKLIRTKKLDIDPHIYCNGAIICRHRDKVTYTESTQTDFFPDIKQQADIEASREIQILDRTTAEAQTDTDFLLNEEPQKDANYPGSKNIYYYSSTETTIQSRFKNKKVQKGPTKLLDQNLQTDGVIQFSKETFTDKIEHPSKEVQTEFGVSVAIQKNKPKTATRREYTQTVFTAEKSIQTVPGSLQVKKAVR